ncbi:MAG: DUF424 family protein [ANME-2 cluster archaeon]|nr:MAG: DUF424 family protein [ANME-2 cluster archaeon]
MDCLRLIRIGGNIITYLKTHISGGTLLVAVCDQELVGQTFSDGTLTLEVSEFFYKGEITSLPDVGGALENAGIVNIVGKRSIAHAIEHGIITEDNIIVIDGVPHAQTVTMPASPQAP